MTSEQLDAFAWAYVLSGRPEQAAIEAKLCEEGDSTAAIRRKAQQALLCDDIQRKVTEYRALLREDRRGDLSARLDELEDARLLAMTLGQPKAAIEAVEAKIRLTGMDTQKRVQIDHVSSDGSAGKQIADPESVAELVRALVG